MNKKKQFALYKGESLITFGTKEEIAKERNVKVASISFYKTPTYKKRTSEEKGLRLVELED